MADYPSLGIGGVLETQRFLHESECELFAEGYRKTRALPET
jgi:hypothetical protein